MDVALAAPVQLRRHLMSPRGLPHTIADGVANHHLRVGLTAELECVAAGHSADALAYEVKPSGRGGHMAVAQLDMDYVEKLGVTVQFDGWRDPARRAAG